MHRCVTLQESEAAVQFIPATILAPLDFAEVFGRDAPVEVDLGCGDGTFLVAMAAANPDRNFLGVERMAGRVRSVCRNGAGLQLKNVRVLRIDATCAVTQLIAPESVQTVHVLFPDPWPKRRHHRRRTITAEFLASIHHILVDCGELHIATDDEDYFSRIRRLVAESTLIEISNAPMAFPPSRFEQRFAAAGTPIYRLPLRKISPVK